MYGLTETTDYEHESLGGGKKRKIGAANMEILLANCLEELEVEWDKEQLIDLLKKTNKFPENTRYQVQNFLMIN